SLPLRFTAILAASTAAATGPGVGPIPGQEPVDPQGAAARRPSAVPAVARLTHGAYHRAVPGSGLLLGLAPPRGAIPADLSVGDDLGSRLQYRRRSVFAGHRAGGGRTAG